MENKNFYKLLLSLLIALIISPVVCAAVEKQALTDDILRFHFRANSNSLRDIEIKMEVRDMVSLLTEDFFCGVSSKDEAVLIANSNLDFIEDEINKYLEDICDYKAIVEVKEEYFESRVYSDITLPQGEYTAFVVTLGDGAGRNYWCIAFPSLCSSISTKADEVFTEDELLVLEDENIEVRFAVLDFLESAFKKIKELL